LHQLMKLCPKRLHLPPRDCSDRATAGRFGTLVSDQSARQ
jgi:hypothetical protein